MRYFALACDYDGTLAWNGQVNDETIAALERVRDSGRKLILVTGRELESLGRVFPRLDLFDRVVAENGALLYRPATRDEQVLAERPKAEFVELLKKRGVQPLSVGRAIVATWEPHETTVLETIRDLGLELTVIFNKGAVMVLPTGLNKASGLTAALQELSLSAHNVVGIGDAENDHAFLRLCECAVAVANAIPRLKEEADWVTRGDHGAGVIELVEQLVGSELQELTPRLTRHTLVLGKRKDESEVQLESYGTNVLLVGPSGAGKSTFATSLLERLIERQYQFCIIDPEGDYESLQGVVVLGDAKRAPLIEEIVNLLAKPQENAILNLVGVPLEQRPKFFQELFPALLKLRVRTGRPHWMVLDETHHLLPKEWAPAGAMLPQVLHGLVFITVHPEQVSPIVLERADVVVAIGDSPDETLRRYAETIGQPPPEIPPVKLNPGEAIAWFRPARRAFWFRSIMPETEHRRHVGKYAKGELPAELVFYFKGPDGKLNLRAQNLNVFTQIAQGVDDETWIYHLKRRDYSHWFRRAVRDEELAKEAEQVETRDDLSPRDSRALILERIAERYATDDI